MVGKDINNVMTNLNAVISNVFAATVNKNKQQYVTGNVNIQIISNSSNCNQYINSTNETLYYASSSIFNQQNVLQSAYANIVSELQNNQDIDITGFGGSLNANQVTTLMNIMQTNLTSNVMSDQESNIINTNYNIQYCVGSTNSGQVIISTSQSIYDLYFQQYSSNSAVQQVTADFANYMSASQSVKVTGVLASLFKMLGVIFAIILIVVVVVIAVIAIGFAKSLGG